MRVLRKKQTRGRAHGRRKHSRRGAVIIEAAAVMPVFVIMMLGLLEFGWAITVTHRMNAGTRSGARLAVLAGSNDLDVEDRVYKITGYRDLLTVTVTVTDADGAASSLDDAEPGDAVEVRTELLYTDASLIVPQYATNFMLIATTTMQHE